MFHCLLIPFLPPDAQSYRYLLRTDTMYVQHTGIDYGPIDYGDPKSKE